MDISTTLAGLNSAQIVQNGQRIGLNSTYGLTSRPLQEEALSADGTMFGALLDSAINNIQTTNNYLSDAENEKLKWALGETESTHDLTIAMEKASTALQYTVAIRDKLLEAYREIMQMQI
ncbi:MAG: flagellar hook-basal body complex protein FliE [Lachnospiraceae bacterium]|nr:flagellar hook-basal body complex protein FliE [Lachnospiraceae bacterium]